MQILDGIKQKSYKFSWEWDVVIIFYLFKKKKSFKSKICTKVWLKIANIIEMNLKKINF